MKTIWKFIKIIFETFKQAIMISIFCITVLVSYDNLKDVASINELTKLNLVYIITLTIICLLYLIQTFKNIKKLTKREEAV